MPQENLETISPVDAFHLAGIISLIGTGSDFNLPWHDCLMPIAPNFLAIERSILECATVGCETIWIVCSAQMQPLLKDRVGEAVQDPVWFARKHDQFPSQTRKQIPIYYVECSPKDSDKRDSQVWGVLYGAKIAKKVTHSLSQWIEPDKYYVSFPLSVYPSQHLREYRNFISREGNFFVLTDEGESILDGKKVGFAFDKKYLGELINLFWRKATGKYDSSQPLNQRRDGKFITATLPMEQRYSGRFFNFQDIFKDMDKENSTKVEMKWYYEINSWKKWKKFLSSVESDILKYPKLKLLKACKWKKIGLEEEIE